MKRARHTSVSLRIAAICAVFLTGVLCAHAEIILNSSWGTGLDSWVGIGSASLSNPGGHLSVTFPAQTVPSASSVRMEHPIAGGYRPEHIAFRFKADDVLPSVVRLCIGSASGRTWYKNAAVTVAGEWLHVQTEVTLEAGWFLGPRSSAEDFETDMNSVESVSVMMVRNGSAKQHSFNVDDFAVSGSPTGSGAPADADGDGMSDAWELAYGLNPSDAGDADADDDNDGLSNYHEYIAGTNPRDPSSTLSVGLDSSLDEEGRPDGFVLTWPSVWGKYYQVWKATNLISGFIMLEGGIESTPPINVYVDSTTPDAGSSFYRVEVE